MKASAGIKTGADLLAYLKGETPNNVSITDLDKIQDALKDSHLPPFYARALQAGREVLLGEKFPVGAQLVRLFSRDESMVNLWQYWNVFNAIIKFTIN